jgi:uncharacterized integral membrane protein
MGTQSITDGTLYTPTVSVLKILAYSFIIFDGVNNSVNDSVLRGWLLIEWSIGTSGFLMSDSRWWYNDSTWSYLVSNSFILLVLHVIFSSNLKSVPLSFSVSFPLPLITVILFFLLYFRIPLILPNRYEKFLEEKQVNSRELMISLLTTFLDIND